MRNLIFIIFLILPLNIQASEVEVIELHENKSLDQMVLDQISTDQEISNELKDENQKIAEEEAVSENSLVTNENLDEEVEIKKNLWSEINHSFLEKVIINATDIKSQTLQNEFNKYLSDLNLDFEDKKNREMYFLIIKYFYQIGELSKAYKLINSGDFTNHENLSYYQYLKINYLLSTFQLEDVCNFKDEAVQELNTKSNFLDKVEIFCLIIQNKKLEADLLNSIMLETQIKNDEYYQDLYLYLTNNDDENNIQKTFNANIQIDSDLLFLYSAMSRIAELPLNAKFLDLDPSNMAIPIILNRSSPIDLRINAANQSYLDKKISIESLAALYQSVDFTSDQLNNYEDTILEFSGNNEILMSFYFQLVNIQIFPSERLDSLIKFWEFAKINNLEDIAYALSFKIVDSIEITSDYLKYSPKIAISYIYNEDYDKATQWIEFYETVNGIDDESVFVRLLLSLYSTNDVNSLIEIINSNFDKLNNKNDELIFVIYDILESSQDKVLIEDFNKIYDERLMPAIFISENIKMAIEEKNNTNFLLYSIVSLNNKEWKDIHPNHLQLILRGYLNFNNGELIKNIIIEIFKNYKIL
tara:strand:- start:156 stop:1913 length:1758 start_codon:yes stop_codon:yes gene_type:complete